MALVRRAEPQFRLLDWFRFGPKLRSRCESDSIGGGLFHVVNRDHVDRCLLGRQLEPKLLLKRVIEAWSGGSSRIG